MDVSNIISERTSCDSFLNKEINPDIVRKILESGRCAPSFKNRQQWRFIVIDNIDKKNKIAEICGGRPLVSNASIIIAPCSTDVDYVMPNKLKSFPIDLSFATSFMMLTAEAEGLSTHVITSFNQSALTKFLYLPFKMQIPMLLLVGYKDESRSKIKKIKKSYNEIVSFNRW